MSEYCSTSEGGKTILIHRQIWIRKHGKIPEGYIIHHINGDKKDNRIKNLECLSQKEHKIKHPPVNRLLSLTEKKNLALKYIFDCKSS